MISFGVTFTDESKKVLDAAGDASYRNLGHAAASIRKDSIESIQPGEGPSAPGTPPHTHTAKVIRRGKNAGKQRKGQLPRAINFDADKESAVIGPRFSVVGLAGKAHELGGEFRGDEYPERPYMLPAMERNLTRFASSYEGSIGG